MMTKKNAKLGSLVQVDLGGGLFAYGLVVSKSEIAFFDYFGGVSPTESLKAVIDRPPLFVVAVMNSATKSGRWPVVGSTELSPELKSPRKYFMQDKMNGDLSTYHSETGLTVPANLSDVAGLECAAVWEAEHIEDRLRDHHAGRSNSWVEQLKPRITSR